MYNINEILNQEVILNFFYEANKVWSLQDTMYLLSLVISVFATIIIPIVIFKLNTKNQKLQALHQKKYEFWLEFSKSFFLMENSLSLLLKADNFEFGVIYQCSKQDIINNLQKLINYWNHFYDLVEGNQKIYLEPNYINVFILQTLFSSIKNLIESDELIITESKGFSVLSPETIKKIISDARSLFENNVKRLGNKQQEKTYIDNLNYYIRKYKNSSISEIEENLTPEEKQKYINTISNKAYLDFVHSNFTDISNKILNIVNPTEKNLFAEIGIIKVCKWFWENIVQKIFSIKNKDSHKILTILWIKIKFKRSL